MPKNNKTTIASTTTSKTEPKTLISKQSTVHNAELKECVQKVLNNYLQDLGNYQPNNLHQLFISEVEKPLLEAVLTYTKGNQSMAAQMLGINRGTLRKKIIEYNLTK